MLLDRVEQLHEVAHVEPVEAVPPDVRLQVDADVGLVPVDGGVAAPLAGEPLVEPVADGQAGGQGLAGAEPTLRLLVVGYRLLLRRDRFEQVADE
nr:hypothetical protein [Streptomyces sp. ISL-86]